jgi:hypothetical protein
MKRAWWSVGLAAGLALSAAGLPAATAAPRASTSAPVVFPAVGQSTYDDVVQFAAADGKYAVYQRIQRSPAGQDRPGQLEVVTSTGHARAVGQAIAADGEMQNYEIHGKLIIGQSLDHVRLVYWWNIATHTAGRFTLPPHATEFEGGTANGYLFRSATNLFATTLDGHKTELAHSLRPGFGVDTTGPNGVVIEQAHRLFYLAYDKPGVLRPLYSKLFDGKLATKGSAPFCPTVTLTTALCQANANRPNATAVTDSLRTGRPTHVVHGHSGVLDGSSIAWIDYASSGSAPTGPIEVLVGHHVKALPNRAALIWNGLGGIISLPNQGQFEFGTGYRLDRIGLGDHARQLTRTIRSGPHALDLAASNNRVDWLQGPTLDTQSTFDLDSRTVTITGGTPTPGPVSTLFGLKPYAGPDNLLQASGDTWLLTTRYGGPDEGFDVAYGSALAGSTTGSGIAPNDLSLSGHRLAYTTPTSSDLIIADLDTGAIQPLDIPAASLMSFDLWGPYLAYSTLDGGIFRLDLDTNTLDTLAPSVPGSQDGFRSTYEYGNEIALVSFPRDPVKVINMTTKSIVTLNLALRVQFVAMTSRGVETEFLPISDLKHPIYYLTPYGSRTPQPIATTDTLGSVPVVNGDLAVWIDPHGRIEAQHLPHRADRPRSLGAPTAPATFTTGGSSTWQADVAYSAPLTTCSIEILDSSKTIVRTLACNPTYAAEGDAVVSWDGTDTAGTTVSPGSYTWRAVVSNADGTEVGGDSVGAITVN